jgi:hypothetical protein
MRLSPDIMLRAEVFAVLDAGTALPEPVCEGRAARPGSENMAKVREGSPRNLGDPATAVCIAVQVHGHQRTRPERSVSAAREQIERRHTGPKRETISAGEPVAGSRSVLIVPTTSGNPAREDPAEGRGPPRRQSCVWETRRVP